MSFDLQQSTIQDHRCYRADPIGVLSRFHKRSAGKGTISPHGPRPINRIWPRHKAAFRSLSFFREKPFKLRLRKRVSTYRIKEYAAFDICAQLCWYLWSAGLQELVAHREKSRQFDTASGRRHNGCSRWTGSYFFKVVAGGIKRQQIPDQKES